MNPFHKQLLVSAALVAGIFVAPLSGKSPVAKPQTLPADIITVDAALDRPVVNANRDESVVVQIKIRPDEIISDRARPPVNLCLVLDNSGSMNGAKIRQAIAAAQEAVNRLGPRDMVSVITYNNSASTLAEAQFAAASNRERIRSALAEVQAGGGTAMYAGLNRGASELRRKQDEGYINRIVLLSDGQANEGPSTVEDFRALASVFAREDIVVSTVGLGNGFNEDVMTTLADAGQGNTYFVENAKDLPRIFGAELGETLRVAATDIEIIIKPKDGVRIKKSLGREAEIGEDFARFRLPQVYGGHDKFALLELDAPVGADGETRDLVDVQVRYVPVNSGTVREQALSVPIRYAAAEEEVHTAANKDVSMDVIENKIVEATIAGIEYSDANQNQVGAANYRQVREEINLTYGYLGDDALASANAKLEQEASVLDRDVYSSRERLANRRFEYQSKYQQPTVVDENGQPLSSGSTN
ncbi:vWA domain-containing protein [Cerasicoccus fimbriatus]|uniref:vWA domain-containing protein n=1 Tax=Cerasicoccus fimbriatus TaxID=3014554 RepID=UPI0022B3630F|nr:VWA domain-containing protein [Cerasicoccus sp. TK19100]